jgi:hypothetical protein
MHTNFGHAHNIDAKYPIENIALELALATHIKRKIDRLPEPLPAAAPAQHPTFRFRQEENQGK